MELTEAGGLLYPKPVALEMGVRRLDSGHIAENRDSEVPPFAW